ncbi:MAG TPA: FAD-dependent oxidoreductase [Longimicrobiaceae bacterium]|nr:FAD-dependent oxidoreductase [Longimicrobiaceae bacterium]
MSRRILHHQPFEPFDRGEKRYDVAVIGGGVSGVYTAWRLKQENRKLKVAVFEYGNRIGGRLYSFPMPGMPHIKAELGGMRWLKSHEIVVGLIDHLNLATREFPMGPDGGSNNLMYLRRRQLRVKDLTDPAMVPYLMNPDEQGMNPDQLQAYVMNSLLPFNGELSAEDWWTVKVLNGTPLYQIGFWNLLYRVLSSEAYQYMYDASGYYTNVANSTAPLSLPITEYDPNNKYYTLDQGFEELPRTLAAEFLKLGGEIHMNHRLDSFGRREEDGDYALCFVETETDEGGRTRDRPGRPEVHVDAERVVLALPRRSIELIRWDRLDDEGAAPGERTLRRRVESVISQAAFKMFLGYPYPWWRALGVEAGRTITDMPIRQTYYFQTESEMGGEPENHNSLLMVSYNDLGSVPFWKALEAGPRFRGRTQNPEAADDPAKPGRDYFLKGEAPVAPHEFQISQEMVQTAQEQVREVHGLKFVPEPYTAVYHDWGEDPYGAGWHAWKAGEKFWEIMPYMRGIPGEKVHVCGEAYSIGQGWVEGALQTAELMLKEHFGLKRPDFIPRKYYDTEMGP